MQHLIDKLGGDISIHAPRTGSDEDSSGTNRRMLISIHAPRTGSDATCFIADVSRLDISIHAPRTGSDERPKTATKKGGNFNPRSPHGERHVAVKPLPF